MFDYIKGKLISKNLGQKGTFVTVECANIGYLIETTESSLSKFPDIASEVRVYTVLLHKEDNMSLCGFLLKEDRDIFKILTSVSGVGPKMALMLLDEFDSFELISLVVKGDFKELTRAKGVGPKLAQKIILELKDKLMNMQNVVPVSIDESLNISNEQDLMDAQNVLSSLGYDSSEIKSAVSKAIKALPSNPSGEDILKESLQILSL